MAGRPLLQRLQWKPLVALAYFFAVSTIPVSNFYLRTFFFEEKSGTEEEKDYLTEGPLTLSAALHEYERRIQQGQTTDSSNRFLVVCNTINPSLLPMFSNFTLVRLNKNETPPIWSAYAFLDPSGCEDHAYVKEATLRRDLSPFLIGKKLSISNAEDGAWVHGVHWPNFSSNKTKFLRLIKNRPFILKHWGEVFWRTHYAKQSCGDADMVVYRAVEPHGKDCLTMHFLQGVSSALNAKDFLEDNLHKSDEVNHFQGNANSHKFCSIIVKFNSSEPTTMFQTTLYDIDAIVRHMFFLQLSEYKPCERITDCPGGPYGNYKCMKGFKFHITMENSLVDGYVSEKIFNGALAGGVPVYFGASDIDRYINPKSFIHCNVSRAKLETMRKFYPRGQKPRPFLFVNSTRPTDKELIQWADAYLRKELEPCVKEVIELDKNDARYQLMLKEKFIISTEIMSGVYPMKGVELAYSLLSNPPLAVMEFDS